MLSMASCSKSELYIYDCECNGKNDSCCLKVTDVNKEGYYLTRAATEKESFGDGDAIGLWIDDGVNSTYNGVSYENIQLEKETLGWKMQRNVVLTKSAAKVYALFPYNADQANTSVALSVDDDTDYLYDIASNVSNQSSAVSLTMKHVRSKLVVRVERDDYIGNGIICNEDRKTDIKRQCKTDIVQRNHTRYRNLGGRMVRVQCFRYGNIKFVILLNH